MWLSVAILTVLLDGASPGVADDQSFADGHLGVTVTVRETEEFLVVSGGGPSARKELDQFENREDGPLDPMP